MFVQRENLNTMFKLNDIIEMLKIDSSNKKDIFYLKILIDVLINEKIVSINKQKISIDINYLIKQWNLISNIGEYFDFSNSSKEDLFYFFSKLIKNDEINFDAVFCPGYTNNGYKNNVGRGNLKKMQILCKIKNELINLGYCIKIKIILADVFLENADELENPFWEKELNLHRLKFKQCAMKYFNPSEILFLSDIFCEKKYIKGFINNSIINSKIYDNFYNNNHNFYKDMGWNDKKIDLRIKKLYTIYCIISNSFFKSNPNLIYLPMENMYFRTKVIESNGIHSLYINKKI